MPADTSHHLPVTIRVATSEAALRKVLAVRAGAGGADVLLVEMRGEGVQRDREAHAAGLDVGLLLALRRLGSSLLRYYWRGHRKGLSLLGHWWFGSRDGREGRHL